MFIFGVSVIKLTGFINLILLLLQFLSGMHYIRMPWRLHKRLGIVFCVTAVLHGVVAYISMM